MHIKHLEKNLQTYVFVFVELLATSMSICVWNVPADADGYDESIRNVVLKRLNNAFWLNEVEFPVLEKS
jgi:hypothetical protein